MLLSADSDEHVLCPPRQRRGIITAFCSPRHRALPFFWVSDTIDNARAKILCYRLEKHFFHTPVVSIYPWKEPKSLIPKAVRQVHDFLRAHHPVTATR